MLSLLNCFNSYDSSAIDEARAFDRHANRLRWSRVKWSTVFAGWAVTALCVAFVILARVASIN